MLTLYHHGSSACAAKVRLALAEKRLEWESRYIDILKGEQFTPEFLAVNPKAVVPVLVHDGLVIRESSVICEYVEEVFPDHPVFPRTPFDRAQVRIWTKAVDEELHPACSAVTYVVSHRHTILRNGTGNFEDFLKQGAGDGVAARERKWRWIQQGLSAPGASDYVRLYDAYLARMEAALRRSRWLVGDDFTMADIALAPYLNRLAALSMGGMWEAGRYPNVARWFDELRQRPTFEPAFNQWMPVDLRDEMAANGRKSWPEVQKLLAMA